MANLPWLFFFFFCHFIFCMAFHNRNKNKDVKKIIRNYQWARITINFQTEKKPTTATRKNICCCCCLFCGQPRVMGCPLFAHRREAVGWVGWSTLGGGKSFSFFLSVVYFLFVLPFAFCYSRIRLFAALPFVVYCLHLMALWGKNAMSMALGTRHSAHGTWAISVSLLSTPEHLPLRGEKKLCRWRWGWRWRRWSSRRHLPTSSGNCLCCTAASAAAFSAATAAAAAVAALFCHVAYYESYVLCKIAYIVCSVVCHLSWACTFLWLHREGVVGGREVAVTVALGLLLTFGHCNRLKSYQNV